MFLSHYFEFGEFRLEPERERLWRKDEVVHLTPKSLKILHLLVENQGRTVTRDQILESVWKDTFIEEGNINFNISLLRKTLRQNGSKGAQFIKTIPKEGYRFVSDVREVIEEEAAGETLVTEVVKEGSLQSAVLKLKESPGLTASRIRWHFVGILLLAVFLLTSFGLWWELNHDRELTRAANSERQIRSIAVLPLKSLNVDTDDRALSLGFADALITSLGQNGEARVISTGAVRRYVDFQKEPLEIGRDLGVDYVLDGSFQNLQGKLRVTLRLLRTSDDTQIWSGSFAESEAEVFHLQDSMVRETARAMSLSIYPKENTKHPTQNVDAYNLFLKGDYLFRLRGEDNVQRSETFFRDAVEIDPYFARAWAGLAAALAMGTKIDEAELSVAHALEVDPNLAEAHATRGFIQMFHHWNWPDAERSLNRAIELDQNSVEAHHWRGVLLSIHGRLDEAEAEMQRALDLDPLSMNLLTDIGQLHYFAREYDKAEEYSLKALSIDPNYQWAHHHLCSIYREQGRDDESFAKHVFVECGHYAMDQTKSMRCSDQYNAAYKQGGWTHYLKRDLKITLREISRNENRPGQMSSKYYRLAIDYLSLGDRNKAIESFYSSLDSKAKYEMLNFTFPYMKVDPRYDSLRDDRRFQELLHRVNL